MIHNDHLGTPQKVTNNSGNVVWSAEYAAFGAATVDASSTVVNNLRYPGQYSDEETGLHNNWQRYYDPIVAKYMQLDRLGFGARDPNLYRYVGNNTINAVDQYGLASHPIIVTLNFWPTRHYGAITMVWGNSLLPHFYRMGTLGSNGKIALPFVYRYKFGQHPMCPDDDDTPYPALNLYTLWKGGNDSRNIPALNVDSLTFDTIEGLNVHKGYCNPDSGSEGCHVIPKKDWNDFMKNFPKDSSGLYFNIWLFKPWPSIFPLMPFPI